MGDFIVVTNCTARKRAGVPLVRFQSTGGSIWEIIEGWRSSLEAPPHRLPAGRLYVGRSIQEAKNVSQALGAQLFIVSAGVGLVDSQAFIPGYDISASGKGTEFVATLTRHGVSKSEWWNMLVSGKGFGWLLSDHPDTTVLLALPSEYVDMVRLDLGKLPLSDLSRLWVFTSPSGQKKIRNLTGVSILPYDERLESIFGCAGTRSDFPQRALKHFVANLKGHLLPIDEAIEAVNTTLSAFQYKESPDRMRLDDKNIRELIRLAWKDLGGNSAKLLRHLRDKELVACEQGRFSRLRRQVEAELKESTHEESQS